LSFAAISKLVYCFAVGCPIGSITRLARLSACLSVPYGSWSKQKTKKA